MPAKLHRIKLTETERHELQAMRDYKRGSWLNMTEIEIGMLGISCLNRRISSPEEFRQEVIACIKSMIRNFQADQRAVYQ